MRKWTAGFPVLACALVLCGCNSDTPPPAGGQPTVSRIGDKIDISLVDLLGKSREELVQLSEEWTTKIALQQKGIRAGTLHLSLLRELHLPLVLPIWRQSQYSNKLGFSLPLYAADTSKDSRLAVHLACYGDTTAARQFVESGDAGALELIEKYRCEREYPVEWTRLVALLLHAAQLRLATGDVDGGTELVVLHRQLRQLLDSKAAQGALGADLLARGWKTFNAAAAAWRAEKKLELAKQAEDLIAEWGAIPSFQLPLPFGASRTELANVLKSAVEGRTLKVSAPNRAFDLFALPFPDEGAEAVIACFNEAGKFDEIFVCYRAGFSDYYPEPEQLATSLEDSRVAGKDNPAGAGLRRSHYQAGELACDVAIVTHGAGLGALVDIWDGKRPSDDGTLRRDLGIVNLDRSFEQNRLRAAPEQRGERLLIKQAKILSEVVNPIQGLKPAELSLQQAPGHDLTAAITLGYGAEAVGQLQFHQVVLPLWATLGPCRIEGVSDEHGGHLTLLWEDQRTRYALWLPYENGLPVQLQIADRQGPEQVAEREANAVRLHRQERLDRLRAGKPLLRVWRRLEGVELGMDRNQVSRALPTGRAVLKRDIPGGLMVTFNGEPGPSDTYAMRQFFIRFDNTGHVAELRARYVGTPAAKGATWMDTPLKSIKADCGAPRDANAPWAKLWDDLGSARTGARCFFWHDDVTQMTYERDAGGVEVTVQDTSQDDQGKPALLPLEYLPRGPQVCALGEERNKLLQQLGTEKPVTTEDGGLLIRPTGPSPYDAVIVWFQGDRIDRIVARHAGTVNQSKGDPNQWGKAVTDAWGQDLSTLGWPRRQDFTPHEALQSLGWHDDRTRVRTFWQEEDGGTVHLFTEWRSLVP